MKKIILLVLFAIFSTTIFAQTDTCESLYIPDHPGYTYNARLVGVHRGDIEFGFGYGDPYNILDKETGMIYNTTYVRYGITKHLEFRFGLEFAGIPKTGVYGLSAFNVGVKVPIITDVKNAPDVAIIVTTYIPATGSIEVGGQFPHYAPNYTLALQKCFFNKLVLFGNTGIFYDGFDTRPQYNASIAPYFFITDNWAVFAETVCRFNSWKEPTNLWDVGTIYYINSNLQWDFSFGTNYVTGIDHAFVNSGICWRIKEK
jgi:hypothetical protein